jgi:hypothetical protein
LCEVVTPLTVFVDGERPWMIDGVGGSLSAFAVPQADVPEARNPVTRTARDAASFKGVV